MFNTLYWVILAVPIGVAVAFLLAALLNNEFRFRPLFRTIFFPALDRAHGCRRDGLAVDLRSAFRADQLDPGVAGLPGYPLAVLAGNGEAFVHYHPRLGAGRRDGNLIAALQDVPRSLYDAAVVDGAIAGSGSGMWHIAMCTPAILFVLLTGLIGAFQNFNLPWIMTQGGPLQASEFYGVYLYRVAFRFFKMGYASALAWLLFVVIILSTVALFKSSARWVYYAGEER